VFLLARLTASQSRLGRRQTEELGERDRLEAALGQRGDQEADHRGGVRTVAAALGGTLVRSGAVVQDDDVSRMHASEDRLLDLLGTAIGVPVPDRDGPVDDQEALILGGARGGSREKPEGWTEETQWRPGHHSGASQRILDGGARRLQIVRGRAVQEERSHAVIVRVEAERVALVHHARQQGVGCPVGDVRAQDEERGRGMDGGEGVEHRLGAAPVRAVVEGQRDAGRGRRAAQVDVVQQVSLRQEEARRAAAEERRDGQDAQRTDDAQRCTPLTRSPSNCTTKVAQRFCQ
jgi:hypothetical protein